MASVLPVLREPLAALLAWDDWSWAMLRVSFSMSVVRRSKVSVGVAAVWGPSVVVAAGVVAVVWEPGVWVTSAAATLGDGGPGKGPEVSRGG